MRGTRNNYIIKGRARNSEQQLGKKSWVLSNGAKLTCFYLCCKVTNWTRNFLILQNMATFYILITCWCQLLTILSAVHIYKIHCVESVIWLSVWLCNLAVMHAFVLLSHGQITCACMHACAWCAMRACTLLAMRARGVQNIQPHVSPSLHNSSRSLYLRLVLISHYISF